MDVIFVLVFFSFIIFIPIQLLLNYKFSKTLKKVNLDIWKEFGSPNLLFSESIRQSRQLNKFIWQKRYLELNDSTLNRTAFYSKASTIIYLGSFALLVVLFIIRSVFGLW